MIKGITSPLFLGLLATLIFSYTSWQFLILRNRGSLEEASTSVVHQLLWELHQKSIDFRLRMRGPRPGTDQVALLTIDERAVASVGRWPWPREYIAALIDRTIAQGAKAIGFDAVFAEPSAQPAQEIFAKIKSEANVTPEFESLFLKEISKRDSDRALAEAIARHGDSVVLGVFFDTEYEKNILPGYMERCHYLIYQQTLPYSIWENEYSFLEVHYSEPPYFPDSLKEAYLAHFSLIESTTREKFPPPQNKKEELDIKTAVAEAQRRYCTHFLDPEQDELYSILAENWDILTQDESRDFLPFDSFENWAENFKTKSHEFSVPVADDWVMNTELISAGAKNTAYFNADQDPDGTIRKKRLFMRTGYSFYPSLALKTYLVANDYNAKIVLQNDPTFGKQVVTDFSITDSNTGEELFKVPVDQKGKLAINYAGKQKMFPYISAAEILSDSPEATIEQRKFLPETGTWEEQTLKVNKAEFLKDKILIFGATAKGIYDLRVTPFDENYPGAETHVTLIDNLLRRDFLITDPREELQLPLILLGVGAITSLGLSHLGAVSGLIFTLITLIGFALVDRFYFFDNGTVTSVTLPLLLVGFLYIFMTFYRYFTEERGKKELKSTFQKYVSPSIVNEILSDPSNIELGGRKMNLTVFFSDVRGFTTISEKLDPRALSDLLNSYLTPMTELVFQNKGTLDKYMGDAIMAFFGAPIPYDDHAKYACRCALQSVEKLKVLQEEYQRKGLPLIDLGIGLNTGEVSVGNMGSETVRNYTVMGDAVNLGSRLEGINKQYGTRIILSEFTYEAAKSDFVCREVDWVRVKGKILPVKIYELIAENKAPSNIEELLKWFQEGYQFYHDKKFEQAIQSFSNALNLNPEDSVTKLYVKRCQDYLTTPPPEDWDGVFTMTSK